MKPSARSCPQALRGAKAAALLRSSQYRSSPVHLWPGGARTWLMLLVACLIAGCTPTPVVTPVPTSTPTVAATLLMADTPQGAAPTRTPLPSVTPAGVQAVVAGATTEIPTPINGGTQGITTTPITSVPSATSALIAAASSVPTSGASATPAGAQPGSPPPFTLALPANWKGTYTLVPITDALTTATMNVAAYAGPVANGGGTGYLFVLWNFPTLLPINPAALPTSVKDSQEQATLTDGYRLLRGSILDATCIVNIYGRNYFKLAGGNGIGQMFQTTGCQDNRPDIVGWYTGQWVGGRQFIFYAYVEPPAAFNGAQPDLTALLASLRFDGNAAAMATSAPVMTVTPTNTPEFN